MAIPRFTQGLGKTLLFTSFVTLAACGGGGGGSKPAPSSAAASVGVSSQATVSSLRASSLAASSIRVVDRSPDAVTFTAINDAEVNRPYASNTVTIKGVDEPVAISITGGRYSKNGGAYTSEASTITNGDTLKLEVMSSAKKEDTKTATVTIGTLSASFSVKTELDREPPVATFSFPTPYTMATGETLNVRGTASDDIEIKSITLHLTDKKGEKAPEIVEAEHLDVDYQPDAPTFSNWKATVPLYNESETEIVVVAKDINGNEIKIDDGDKVVVRERTDYSVAFPDGKVNTGSYRRMVFDPISNSIFHGSNDRYEGIIYKTDIKTARMSQHYKYNPTREGSSYLTLKGAARNKQIYFLASSDDDSDGMVLAIDVIDTNENPSQSRYLLSDEYLTTNLSIDSNILITTRGANSGYDWIIESYALNSDGEIDLNSKKVVYWKQGKNYTSVNESIYINELGVVVYPDYYEKSINSVNIVTGEVKTISSLTVGDGDAFNTNEYGLLGSYLGLETILYNRLTSKLIVGENLTGNIFEIDPETGKRKILLTIGFPYISPGTSKLRQTISSQALYLDENRHVFYSSQTPTNSILVIDPVSGGQVVLSKDENPKYPE